MDRVDLIIRLIEAGFEQRVDRSHLAVNKKGEPLVSYKKTLPDKSMLSVELRRNPDDRYNCCRYEPLIDPECPDEWEGGYHHARCAERTPATVNGEYFREWGSTADQVLAFLEAEGGLTPPPTKSDIDIETLEFKKGDWQFTEDMGDFGRIDTILGVEGHPRFDGIRWYLFPGGGGECMEWTRDGDHFTEEEESIPDDIREKAMEIIVDDLRERLKAHTW